MAFTDNAPVSTGIKSQHGGRSAPTVINRAYSLAQFWDGRGPIANPIEMGMTHDGVVERIRGIKGYRPLFAAAFGSEPMTLIALRPVEKSVHPPHLLRRQRALVAVLITRAPTSRSMPMQTSTWERIAPTSMSDASR
jgi:hypothetical protein